VLPGLGDAKPLWLKILWTLGGGSSRSMRSVRHHVTSRTLSGKVSRTRDEGLLPAVHRDERRAVGRVHDKSQERPGSGGRDSRRSAPEPSETNEAIAWWVAA
jgi:hypothetical protein